jgi:hypothetical protein
MQPHILAIQTEHILSLCHSDKCMKAQFRVVLLIIWVHGKMFIHVIDVYIYIYVSNTGKH